jgi:hypothetical protein
MASSPKEGVLPILIVLKNPSPSPPLLVEISAVFVLVV